MWLRFRKFNMRKRHCISSSALLFPCLSRILEIKKTSVWSSTTVLKFLLCSLPPQRIYATFQWIYGEKYIYTYIYICIKKKVQIKGLLSYLELFSACKGKGLSLWITAHQACSKISFQGNKWSRNILTISGLHTPGI